MDGRSIALASAIFCLLIPGCGHPASEQECEQILERVARLELKERRPGASEQELEQDVEATKQALRDSTMKNCVGKRITDDAMKCVENATTSKQIIEDCFD